MARLIIEHQGRGIKVDEFPLAIGSAADNDIIIANAAPYHAVIEESGEGVQLRALDACHLHGKAVHGTRLLDDNARLNVGGVILPLWLDVNRPMPPIHARKRWAWVTHPLAALIWFVLALALPLWLGYLSTPQRYILDYQIIFIMSATIIALVWLMNAFLLPLAGRHLVIPLLGIVSWLSVFNDLCEQAAYYFNFQLNGYGFNLIALLLTIAAFFWVLRGYLHDSTALAGRMLNRYTLGAGLPCVLLLLFTFLSNNDYFAQRDGSYPSYHRGLLPTVMPGVAPQAVDDFFEIDKTK